MKKNAIIAKKVEINEKLRSKLSILVKNKKLGNSDLDLDEFIIVCVPLVKRRSLSS